MNAKELNTIAKNMLLAGLLLGIVVGRTGEYFLRSDNTISVLIVAFLMIGIAVLMHTGYQIYKWSQFMDHVFKSGGSSAELSKSTEDELIHDH